MTSPHPQPPTLSPNPDVAALQASQQLQCVVAGAASRSDEDVASGFDFGPGFCLRLSRESEVAAKPGDDGRVKACAFEKLFRLRGGKICHVYRAKMLKKPPVEQS